ncbi:AMP-binding protein [Olleya aquimaris]|uniref:O-succinylbenzoic acid--CoA ligase n=1 Tax=Olleya aquimaris TaxID=639310 RepID=A0A327RKZ1_9FLAO|nr:AMP-binding protein [Olleya aquimaris]RAJ16284.1 O-succinylbenzoic acid--CoA ligase [Olleya aquimaris]
MTPTFDKVHNRFKLNGNYFSFEDLKEVGYSLVKEGEPFEKDLGNFLLDWLDDKDVISVNTSGSTGQPKTIQLNKQAMVHSAIATGDFFKLQPGDSALHCLPTTYIAGKMMLVRAIVLGLELDVVEPTTNPIFDPEKHYDFCAMIPVQVLKTVHRINNIKTLIVGGAPVSYQLKDKLQGLKTKVFETYGMTETITHIAVKPLNASTVTSSAVERSHFQTLPNITISQNKKDCLVIEAPQLIASKIETNDIVKLHSNTSFQWLGRLDNVINSGGVKLFPEQIEAKLQSTINSRFFISSEKDNTFGEVAILVIEAESNTLKPDVFSKLTAIETPKNVYAISPFSETSSGKIDRNKTLARLKK